MTERPRLSRRALLGAGASLAGCVRGSRAPEPELVGPPQVLWGIQSGDVSTTAAIVWSKTDRPARLVVEWSTAPDFRDARRFEGPLVTSDTDFTGKVELSPLPRDSIIHYRASFVDARSGAVSPKVTGHLRVAPSVRRDVFFVWGADTCGQGYGIAPEFDGLLTYASMANLEPDFFVHAGDVIYADVPIEPEKKLEGGGIWRNVTTPAVSHVAETLDDFRGRFAYNLTDAHVRAFAARVPAFYLWDDHDTHDNWYPDQVLPDARYREKRAAVLSERARRALFEYTPMRRVGAEARRLYRAQSYGPALDLFFLDGRSYRGANGPNREGTASPTSAFLGRPQLEWLERNLLLSKATWKVLVLPQPIGLVVRDPSLGVPGFDGIANGVGAPSGRELEIARLLAFLAEHRLRNVVFLTGDVHYAAALRYEPSRASFKGFLPFWEFVAGPLHAGTFGPAELDPTFGPEVLFQKVPPRPNAPPSEGLQFFGGVHVDGRTDAMTVTLHDRKGTELYRVTIPPER